MLNLAIEKESLSLAKEQHPALKKNLEKVQAEYEKKKEQVNGLYDIAHKSFGIRDEIAALKADKDLGLERQKLLDTRVHVLEADLDIHEKEKGIRKLIDIEVELIAKEKKLRNDKISIGDAEREWCEEWNSWTPLFPCPEASTTLEDMGNETITQFEDDDATTDERIAWLVSQIKSMSNAIKEKEHSAEVIHKGYEKEREYMKPLYEAGVDIRLRRMEYDVAHGKRQNEAIIDKGNVAAHQGCCLADALIFELEVGGRFWFPFLPIFCPIEGKLISVFGSSPSYARIKNVGIENSTVSYPNLS